MTKYPKVIPIGSLASAVWSSTPEDLKRMRLDAGREPGDDDGSVARLPTGLIRCSEIVPREVEWLWPLRLARGKLNVLQGDPGKGKSTLTCAIAAAGSRPFLLPGASTAAPFATIFMSAEDDADDTIVPRLIAAAADLDRVAVLDSLKGNHPDLSLPAHISALGACVEALKREGNSHVFVVVDPLACYYPRHDENKPGQMRAAMSPLREFAKSTQSTVLIVRHLNKTPGASALYRGAGSLAVAAAARSVLHVANDPGEDGQMVLAHVKSNVGVSAQSLTYRLRGIGSTAVIDWTGTSTLSADQLVDDEQPGQLKACVEWLRETLSAGPKPSGEIFAAAEKERFSERTVKRAKAAAKVEHERTKGPKARYLWSLPTPPIGTLGIHGTQDDSK